MGGLNNDATPLLRNLQNPQLVCPECHRVSPPVYHTDWEALGCQYCGSMVDRGDWIPLLIEMVWQEDSAPPHIRQPLEEARAGFEVARARRTDPQTSHDAAASVTEMTAKQNAVLAILGRLGGEATDYTIHARYEASHDFEEGYPIQSRSGLRTRRSELVVRDLIRDTGKTEKLPSGRRATVWGVTH